MILTALQSILLVLIGIYFAWMIITHASTWVYFGRYDRNYPLSGYEPKVSIIKPVYGIDQSALENFQSFCNQDYSNDYEIFFCVEDRADLSIPLIDRAIRERPDRNMRLALSDPKETRSLGKIKNMITGLAKSSFEVVIFSDSDAHVTPSFLRETTACVQNPGIGLGFGAPAFEGAEDWVAALMNISVNELVLPIATACHLGIFDGAVGTTMVARREVVEQVGGLKPLGYQATDDISLAREILKKGYQIHLLKQPARVFHRHDSFKRWWHHTHRWLVIIHHYWPVKSFLKNLVMLAPWWSLFYIVISLVKEESIYVGVSLIVAVLTASLISSAIINLKFVHCNRLWRFLWVVPLQELFRLPLILHSYLRNEVDWRGRRFRINSKCEMRLVMTPENLRQHESTLE